MYKLFFKRIIDISISLLVLVISLPLLIIVIILLAWYNNGKVFFIQKRPGLNENEFNLLKFKTMRDAFTQDGIPLPDKERITAIGRFVRKTSIDELPQLINVLKGDMSLIGPRPLLMKYLPLYNEFQKRRHEIKPGITGWAQINGRNAISWKEKFELDVFYVDNVSFMFDLKIIIITFVKVFRASNINADNNSTMKSFQGNN